MPQKGTVAEPGLVGMAPGKGVMTIEPVSVCLNRDQQVIRAGSLEPATDQKVSTTEHSPLPTWVLYHVQASGLMGSPTLPKILKLDKS